MASYNSGEHHSRLSLYSIATPPLAGFGLLITSSPPRSAFDCAFNATVGVPLVALLAKLIVADATPDFVGA
jgi:hypothetical protein